MVTLLIGAKWDGHDSAVFLAKSGQAPMAVSTERVTRYKHDRLFPLPALDVALEHLEGGRLGVDRVVFRGSFSSDKDLRYPALQYELEQAMRAFFGADTVAAYEAARADFDGRPLPIRLAQLVRRRSGWRTVVLEVGRRLRPTRSTEHIVRGALRARFPGATVDIDFVDHEWCHALSAAATCPWSDDVLVVAMDGSGDNNDFTAAFIVDSEEHLREIARSSGDRRVGDGRWRLSKLCSPGGVYSLITHHLGFRMDSDEGKTEALAAYGSPIAPLLEELLAATKLDPETHKLHVDANRVERALYSMPGGKDEKPDVAATAQAYLEAAVVPYLDGLMSASGKSRLAVAGGVFANVVLNLRILEEVTGHLHVTPAMGDDGSAQGACVAAAMATGLSLAEASQITSAPMPFLGPAFPASAVEEALSGEPGVVGRHLGDLWHELVAQALHRGQTVAVCRGPMEWGPRALGHRSVLTSASRPGARSKVNSLKGRSWFQPVCPVVIAEDREALFEQSYHNPHMTCTFRLRPEVLEVLPEMAHVDGTARAQIVGYEEEPDLYRVAQQLKRLDGWGVILNTSFNRHGRTMVMTPADALTDFLDSDIDVLILQDYWVECRG